ncbi:MAG TPA: polyphenol oxidase family protein [Thermoleophilaceae bacterium]
MRTPPAFEVALPGARAFFSTRLGGESSGPFESLNLGILTDDQKALVVRNRARFAKRVGLASEAIVQGMQVHGAEIKEWGERGASLDEVDGHVTQRTDLGLLVLVADCLPLALAAPGRIAMIHCGWRGLAGGIVEEALATFATEPPAAALGPCIGRCCYEVGDEVLAAFAPYEGAATGRMLSLRAVAEAKLRAGGVERIEHVEVCTSCNPDLLFSHRRDGGVTGRQCGVVVRA